MAKSAGKKASNFIVWIILLLLVVGLAGFGATNFGGSTQSVGSVGDTEIGVNDYARALQNELNALQSQTGQVFPLAQAQAFGIDRRVLQRLVADAALDNETASIGLSVGDEEVGQRIREIPGFQGLDGSFDRSTYEARLRQNGSSIGEFEDIIRAESARTILQGAVLSGAETPAAFTDTLFAYARERRDFTWAQLGAGDLNDPVPEPSDADLQAYYEANPDNYTVPETKKLTYVWLSPDMLVDTITPDEDALRAMYDERIEEYVRPERRLVERLIYPDQAAADAARARLDAGEVDFEDLVAERELELDDVDFGDPSLDELGGAGEAVFALTEPGVAGPVETDLGPALFRVNAILTAQETTFQDVRQDLLDEFAIDTARRQIEDEIDPIDDLLAGGATLEELAEEAQMELSTLDWTPDASDGIAAFAEFREAAAAVQDGDFPEVIQSADGSLFALRLDELVAPALRPLDEVQAQVIQDWDQAETEKRLLDQIANLTDEAPADDLPTINRVGSDGAEELAEGAGPFGASANTEIDVLRDGFIEGGGTSLVETVFEMKAVGDVTGIAGADGTVIVVRLDAINEPAAEDEESAALKDGFAQQTAESIALDMLTAFTNSVQNQAGITINQPAISAVHAQFP